MLWTSESSGNTMFVEFVHSTKFLSLQIMTSSSQFKCPYERESVQFLINPFVSPSCFSSVSCHEQRSTQNMHSGGDCQSGLCWYPEADGFCGVFQCSVVSTHWGHTLFLLSLAGEGTYICLFLFHSSKLSPFLVIWVKPEFLSKHFGILLSKRNKWVMSCLTYFSI